MPDEKPPIMVLQNRARELWKLALARPETDVTFTAIVPCHGNHAELMRTLSNLCYQAARPKTEILVASDGPDEMTEQLVHEIQAFVDSPKDPFVNHNVTLRYMHTPKRLNNGNVPRAMALKEATNDWIMFVDAGTGVLIHLMAMVADTIRGDATTGIVLYDVLVCAPPSLSLLPAFWVQDPPGSGPFNRPENIAGVGATVRRDLAQRVPWPQIQPSDAIYWSKVWDELLAAGATAGVVGYPLVVAYAHKDNREAKGQPFGGKVGVMPTVSV